MREIATHTSGPRGSLLIPLCLAICTIARPAIADDGLRNPATEPASDSTSIESKGTSEPPLPAASTLSVAQTKRAETTAVVKAAPLPENRAEPQAETSTATDTHSDAETTNSGTTAAEPPAASPPESKSFGSALDNPPPFSADAIGPISFNGVKPEETSAAQLAAQWGEGNEVSHVDNQTVLRFAVDAYSQVDVTLVDGRVRSILVQLEQPTPADTLARKLKLADVRPVSVPDDSGELLGQAYPERGVLFGITPDGKRVSHVVIEKVDPSTFVLRAEAELERHQRASLADLNFAISRQPRSARALWLRAKLYASQSRFDDAMADIDSALEIEPNQALYHLTRAEIHGKSGQYDDAGREIKEVLAGADVTNEVKAKALCQLGDMLAASPAHDYKLATEHHMSSVKLADPLSVDKNLAVRRAAKRLLVDAHLGVANDIACGAWQQKDQAVVKWLDRAEGYAEDLITHEDGDPALRLHVARGALNACAGAQGKIDAVPWAKMAIEFGKPLVVSCEDPWTRAQLEWELGLALADGLMTDELRGATQHALANTALTVMYLENGAKYRRETPEEVFELGWLYYRLGALHAIRRNDHKTAVAWYEKAYPLLDRPIPLTLRSLQGRYGEWLVSMGISYWETGSRDLGLQLTDAGMQHVQEAVRRKIADEKSLAIPCSNLAFMHQTLGHAEQAKSFSQLAAKYDANAIPKR